MTDDHWPLALAKAQGRAIQHYRELAGLTHKELAQRLSAIGQPMQRTTLINIEQGRRKAMSVPEMFALGYVLDVPPAMLMIPLGLETRIEVIEGVELDSWRALAWVSGELGFNHETRPENTADRTIGQEVRSYYTAVQELAENLLDTDYILENADHPDVLKEAHKRAKEQPKTLEMYLDIISKRGLTLPQLPALILEKHPRLSRFFNG